MPPAIVAPGGNLTRATCCMIAVSRMLISEASSTSVPAPRGMKFATTARDSSAVIATNAGSRTTAISLISLPMARSTTETVWLPRFAQ